MARLVNNDVLRSIRYLLDLSEPKVLDYCQTADAPLSRAEVQAWLKKDDDPDYQPLPDAVLLRFLDRLILARRGPSSGPTRPTELQLDNNLILKKLRVAFELKEQDLLDLLQVAGFKVSRGELSALFRHPDHSNFRPCGDQFLRNLLKALVLRYRSPDTQNAR